MIKIKSLFLALIVATIMLFLCVGSVFAYADESVQTGESQQEEIGSTQVEDVQDGVNIEQMAAQFTDFLKEKYGEDYEFYYNQIISNWGSVEAYLLSFGTKLPEEYKSSWESFVEWMGKYAAIWAPPLAILIVIIVAIVGKKKFNEIVERIVKAKIYPIENELNAQSKATVAMMRSQRALLGSADKFTDNVKELTESEKELTNG